MTFTEEFKAVSVSDVSISADLADTDTPVLENPEVEVEGEEEEKEEQPELELELETQEIIRELIADFEVSEISETQEATKEFQEQKSRKLRMDASVWRSQALYRLKIAIFIGRGSSNITIRFEDILEIADGIKTALTKSGVKTTIPVSKGINVLRNKLYGIRQKILDKHFVEFGGELVVPQENFQEVLKQIQDLFAELETAKRKAIRSSKTDLRTFLTRIGRLCDKSGFTGERKKKILKHYRAQFPTTKEIQRIFIYVSAPEEIPSYRDMILGDSQLAAAEASREEAATRVQMQKAEQAKIQEDLQAVRRLQQIAQEQIKSQWQETYNRLNEGFLTLVEEQLQQLTSDRSEMNGDQRRHFSQALNEMQNFLTGGDATLQDLMNQVEGLGEFIEGTGNAELRRHQLDQRIKQIREQFSEKFTSLRTDQKGHRARALDNFQMNDDF